ncbi:MAG: gamma-glutamyltransferase [Acidobacteria bacterium]|nr:MAG: gamma-glutamyltransferase [Acidobacteriota bacterium]MCE7960111.1 gamma-glutamyltransferase [Acidobacteria bacterium ACB2]
MSRSVSLVLAATALLPLLGAAAGGGLVARGRGTASRAVVWARNGMVAAAQPLAVQAGLEVLRKGGSAVDAAIATNACLGLMEPVSCGLGGDLFAVLWDPKAGKVAGLNASGRAPASLTAEKVPPAADGTIPYRSPYAWTVPGCADGWAELHARYGKLPLPEVLAPAIRYAEEGFPVSAAIAAAWARGEKLHRETPGFAEVFLPGGKAPAEGETFRNPALASTLRRIAARGREGFYSGPVAEAIVAFSKEHGGFFTLEDLAEHRSTWDAPVSASYRGFDVWELPPPGQGLSALQILNLLEGFDLARWGRSSPDFWHVLVEAKKLAFADRARYFADPAFAKVPVEALLSKAYARERAKRIDMGRAAAVDPPGDPLALATKETTYLCAADASGMMVSLIQSNYAGFGSGHAVPSVGIGLQNRGALFSLKEGHPNRLEPRKRPFHTIIPALVTKGGQPLLVFGLMGGDMQPQGHAQVVVNLVDLGMNLQEAGDAPRFHHGGSSEPTGTVMTDGGVLHLEDGIAPEVSVELSRRGHRIERTSTETYGGYQAIYRDPATGAYAGATERRKDGCAQGF